MAKLIKKKLDALIDHLNEGGDTDVQTVAPIVGVEPSDALTISAYIRRARKEIEEPEETTAEEPSGETAYQLMNAEGTLEDLDVVKVKGRRVILQRKVPTDIVNLIIRGVEIELDLEKLRVMPAGTILHGIEVGKLIAAAELARL